MADENFIMVKKSFLEGIDDEHKSKWLSVKQRFKDKEFTVVVSEQKMPGKLEGTFTKMIIFVVYKLGVKLASDFEETSNDMVDKLEKYMDKMEETHEFEVY